MSHVPSCGFAEKCFADEYLQLPVARRIDFDKNYEGYAAKARELLDAGVTIGNADVCRALKRAPGWGKRYWILFRGEMADALDGSRKVRWKDA